MLLAKNNTKGCVYMGVIRDLYKVIEQVCDKYCKYPEQYESKYDDPDEAWEKMYEEKCDNCPLSKL